MNSEALTEAEVWRIRIAGYGTFDFHGTEDEAEKMRAHKSRWERGHGMKWRASLATDLDRATAEMAKLWDAGKGVPSRLCRKRDKLRRALLHKGESE